MDVQPADRPGPTRGLRKRTVLTAVIASAVTALVVGPGAVLAATSFVDVPADHPFHDDITWMADTGISTGYDDGTFRPSAPLTRQAMSAFLHRAYELQTGEDLFASTHPFDDYGVMSTTFVGASSGDVTVEPLVVEVPPGTTGSIEVVVSSNVGCSEPDPETDGCELRVLVDGDPALTSHRVGWVPASQQGARITSFVVTTTASLAPGPHEVVLQHRVVDLDGDGDTVSYLAGTDMTAEVHLR